MRFSAGLVCSFEYAEGGDFAVKSGKLSKSSGNEIIRRSRCLFLEALLESLEPSVEFLMIDQFRCNALQREMRNFGISP